MQQRILSAIVIALTLSTFVACSGVPRVAKPDCTDPTQCTDAGSQGTDAGCPVAPLCTSGAGDAIASNNDAQPTATGCSNPDDVAIQAIATGSGTCVLTTAGGVRCFGPWDRQVWFLPTSDIKTGIRALAVGGHAVCTLSEENEVTCFSWFTHDTGYSGVDGGLGSSYHFTGVAAISVGATHACALMSPGLRCWGFNDYGQFGDGTLPSDYVDPNICRVSASACRDLYNADRASGCGVPLCAQAVTVGYAFTCVLTSSRGVRCWGKNSSGQLGDGTTNNRKTPPDEDAMTEARAIAAGAQHVCAVTISGGVSCWGDNTYGQLGDGTTTNRSTPIATAVLTDVQAVSAGTRHTCVLTTAGGVRCWGNNDHGQLGDGTTTSRTTPPETDALTGAKSVSAGDDYTCALMISGGVQCWGSNSGGQLGDPHQIMRPRKDVLTNVQAIAAGGNHTCALTKTGGVRCWGANSHGQLGDSSTIDRNTPPDVDTLTDVKAVAAGGYSWPPPTHSTSDGHTCVIMTSGGVRCWGQNNAGQLGNGSSLDIATAPTSDVLTGATAIATGGHDTCALTETGGVRCWGENARGQLGDGTTANRSTPPDVDVLGNVRSLGAGAGSHTCAITLDGGLRCWGDTFSAQPGNDVLTDVEAVATGSLHTCALTTAGGVRCWGSNSYGQLGYKASFSGDVLLPPSSDVLTEVAAIASGSDHVCALMKTGRVRCWGLNQWGALGVGDPASPPTSANSEVLSDVQAIAAGLYHTCALTTAGGVRCWGANDHGQLGHPDDIADVLSPLLVPGTCQ